MSDYTTLLNALKSNLSEKNRDLNINTSVGTIDDIYQKVMSIENDRLSLLNKIIDQQNSSIWKNTIFLNKSILEISKEFTVAWTFIFNEIFVKKTVKNVDDLFRILYDNDRKIYVGLMIIFISFFMFFIHISK